jgi:glutaredoxin 3
MNEIIIYTKDHCPYCRQAKALFNQKGLAFNEIDIEGQPDLRAEMIEKSGGGYTVPQIFINQQHIGGCDDLMALEYQGKLAALLK